MKRVNWIKIFGFLFMNFLIFVMMPVNIVVAQGKYPTKPITLVVPFAAGGGHDLAVRALQPHIEKALGVSVIVTNRPGGGATIGHNEIKTTPPDGYLFAASSNSLILIKYTLPESKLSYDQFEPIAFVGYTPLGLLTSKDARWNTIKEVVDYARANPEKLRCGNSGVGGIANIGAIGIEQVAGVKFTHIPFKGAAALVPAILGGHVDIAVSGIDTFLSLIKEGSIKLLGVTAPERVKFTPKVPTFKELGMDVQFMTYIFFIGPKGIPQDRVKTLYEALKKSAETNEVKAFFDMQAVTVSMKNPEELGQYLKEEDQRIGKLIKTGKFIP